MKSFLKKILLGTNIPQEYICIAVNEFDDPLELKFRSGNYEADITGRSLFLGYKHLIIGVAFENIINVSELKDAEISFTEKKTGKQAAVLKLKLESVYETDKNKLAVYKGMYGSHKLLNPLQKLFADLAESRQKKQMSNVDLPGNIYEQVKIAYSVPRKICLVTLGGDGNYNLFPTDLHGRIDEDNYVISLRSGGKANEQVNHYKKIVLSQMNLNRYKYVYSLGKNHMQEPKPPENFELTGNYSQQLKLPLPEGCIEYFELEHVTSEINGIHNLNFFKITGSAKCAVSGEPVLSHIHRVYLSWLIKNGYNIKYNLR